jgi:uncharacterized protein with gpF-like domain
MYTRTFRDFKNKTLNDHKAINDLTEEEIDFIEDTIDERAKEVNETTRNRLYDAILAILLLGGGKKEIVKAIDQLFKEDIPIRSKSIADTETITAGNAGSFFAAKFLGVKAKEWVAILDDRTRENHREVNGETIPIEENYSNGLRFPGDPRGPAHLVINCRCVERYHL